MNNEFLSIDLSRFPVRPILSKSFASINQFINRMLMKKLVLLLLAQILFSQISFCQTNNEKTIRKLENEEKIAILKGDTVALRRLMSQKIVVQNPDNAIVTYRQIMDRIKSGKIDYSSFERVIDKVTFTANIAVVMGKEIIKAEGQTSHAGKTITRRFTNVWIMDKTSWKLVARQATIVLIE